MDRPALHAWVGIGESSAPDIRERDHEPQQPLAVASLHSESVGSVFSPLPSNQIAEIMRTVHHGPYDGEEEHQDRCDDR